MMRKQNNMSMYMFLAVVLIIFVFAGIYFGSNITENFIQNSFLEEKQKLEPIIRGPYPRQPVVEKQKIEPIRGPSSRSPVAIAAHSETHHLARFNIPPAARSRFLGIFNI